MKSIAELKPNPTLKDLPVYQPGRPIEEVARELGLPFDNIIKLASNENPLGPSPLAVEAMKKAVERVNLYPDGNAFYLKNKLAEKLGVSPDNLILGNGSNEIIEFVGHVFINPEVEVVVSEYCFAIYPIVTKMFGGRLVTVPAKNYGHDLKKMLKAITDKTAVVFVANPNNPTGTMASENELVELIDNTPESVLLVIDEAYIEFLDNPPNALKYIKEGKENLLLMRTFSKIYGLAGLRLGYGIGSKNIINVIEKVRQPFNINSVAQQAALSALDDVDHIRKTKQNNKLGIEYYEKELKQMRLEYLPTYTNFILVKVGDGNRVFAELQKLGVIVRPMGVYGLPDWIRITIGTPSENHKCIDALKKVLNLN
ncbi:MAG: histidinol-phosphate transaminase [Verrucomicrobiia bacterium]